MPRHMKQPTRENCTAVDYQKVEPNSHNLNLYRWTGLGSQDTRSTQVLSVRWYIAMYISLLNYTYLVRTYIMALLCTHVGANSPVTKRSLALGTDL